jgi:hypothetical protein
MQVFASLLNILAPLPDAPLAVGGIFERCLERCVNAFGREALLTEKANDDFLVVLDPLNENEWPLEN